MTNKVNYSIPKEASFFGIQALLPITHQRTIKKNQKVLHVLR